MKRLCWGWLRNISAEPLFCNIYLFLSQRGFAEDDWGIYQLSLYSVTSISFSLLRMKRLCWGWLRNISAEPLFCNIYIFLSPQDEEAVLRMTEEYISSSSILSHISLSSGWQGVLRMAEEYISSSSIILLLSLHQDERLCWGWLRNIPAKPSPCWGWLRNIPAKPSPCWGWLRNIPAKPSPCWGWLRNAVYQLSLHPLIYPSFLRMKRLCWGWLRYGATKFTSWLLSLQYSTAKLNINSNIYKLYNFLQFLQWNNFAIN